LLMPTVDITAAGRYALPAEAARAQVAAALAAVGLADVAQRPTHTLSGGQRQRCAIAGALAQMPKARARKKVEGHETLCLAPHPAALRRLATWVAAKAPDVLQRLHGVACGSQCVARARCGQPE